VPPARSRAGAEPAALGLRVRTGRIIVVLLAGPPDAPRVTWHDELEIFDPALPETVMPWHQALELPPREGQVVVRKAGKAVRALAARRVRDSLDRAAALGLRPRGAGIVVGSLLDPAEVSNDHMRAHAEEGRLSRVAVEEALRAQRLSPQVLGEKEAWERAAAALGRSAGALKRAVDVMGKQAGRPWRAHEKLAAVAAWVALAD